MRSIECHYERMAAFSQRMPAREMAKPMRRQKPLSHG
jgi:hypothetical protein